MKMLHWHSPRRSSGKLLLSGAGMISFDHTMRCPHLKPTREAMADDWKAIGGDLRWAIQQVANEIEAA